MDLADPGTIEPLADHIAAFCLNGLKGLRKGDLNA
jgi:hypothetical protein